MQNKHPTIGLSLAVLLSLLMSLANVASVLADDTTPPPADSETSVPTEVPISTPEPVSTDGIDSASDNLPAAVSDVLSTLPEDTEVVVLDENGAVQPLVTEAAAQIITNSDPIWCPAGQDPGNDLDDSVQDCTNPHATVADLITEIGSSSKTGSGTVYFTSTYSTNDATFDHSDSNLASLTDLTVQGGWNGNTGGSYGLSGDSTFSVPLSVVNWGGSVTVNNIFVDGSGGNGISIYTSGNVALNDVTSTNNDGNGLYVETGNSLGLSNVDASNNDLNGAEFYGQNVTVTNSSFNDNGYGVTAATDQYSDSTSFNNTLTLEGGSGLIVVAPGNVTLTDVVADGNANDGAFLTSNSGNINITDGEFDENGSMGHLEISYTGFDDTVNSNADFQLNYQAGNGLTLQAQDGNITLNDVVADGNANYGANIEVNGALTITNSEFIENGWSNGIFDPDVCNDCGYGFMYDYLNDFCDDNPAFDAAIFNPCGYYNGDYSSDYIDVQGPNFDYNVYTANNGSDTNMNYFIDQSGGTGLFIEGEDGNISLNGVEAIANSGLGADISSDQGNIQISNGLFIENGYMGSLSVGECSGNGTLDCLGGQGADGSVGGYLSFAYLDGLLVNANEGNVTLDNVGAYGNANDGADVGSRYGSVTVTNSEFMGNGNYPVPIGGEDGLFGWFLYDQFGLDQTIELPVSEFSLGLVYYQLSGDDYIEANIFLETGSGLEVDDAQTGVNIQNIEASYNGGHGANIFVDSSVAITSSDFYENGFLCGCSDFLPVGLNGELDAQIDLTNPAGYIAGSFTTSDGLYINSTGNVTLTDVNASGNAFNGADVWAGHGNVTVNGGSYNENGQFGLSLSLIITPSNSSFNVMEGGSGLYILSAGTVTLDHVQADGNYNDGADVDHSLQPTYVICGEYSNNGNYGVSAESNSLILKGPPVMENNGDGTDAYDYESTGPVVDGGECDHEKHAQLQAISAVCAEGELEHTFMLPNGDHITVPCPINDYAVLLGVSNDKLPGDLDASNEFLSALSANVVRGNEPVQTLTTPMLVAFALPEGVGADHLAILYWNGTQWTELEGHVSADGLYFETTTTFTGTFVLVKK